MPARRPLLAVAAVALLSGPAFGLATEHFGNAPVRLGFPTDDATLLPILNDPGRVYWYEVNGDASFYYRGDAAALNAMLAKFAAKGREVVLHAGPLTARSLGGDKAVEAQWFVHVPGGISLSHMADGGLVADAGPAMHVYIPAARVAGTDPRIAGWIADLGSPTFDVRDRADQELRKQGMAAEAALVTAAATATSPEARERAQGLLDRLPAVGLARLRIPEGLAAVGPAEQAARCTKALKSKEPVVRGVAAGRLADLEPDRKKAVEGLLKVLKDDDNEYVRRSVAGRLQREGWAARAALPELRKFVDDPDVNVQRAFRAAVEAVEAAEEPKDAVAKAKLLADVQADVAAYLKSRAAK